MYGLYCDKVEICGDVTDAGRRNKNKDGRTLICETLSLAMMLMPMKEFREED